MKDGRIELLVPIGTYTVELKKSGFITEYYNVISSSDSDTIMMVISPCLTEGEYRVVLTWGENPVDLDSHLSYTDSNYSGFHVHYSIRDGFYNGSYWASLDVDDTDSFGPETITFTFTSEMLEGGGKFEYWVYNYAYRYSNSKSELSESEAVVKVYMGSELKKTYYIPKNKEGITWEVFNITSEGIKTINTIN